MNLMRHFSGLFATITRGDVDLMTEDEGVFFGHQSSTPR